MLLKDINPFVRQVLITGVGTAETNYSHDVFFPIKTIDCRLFYITGGIGEMIVEDKTYALHPGCAIMFQSGTKYVWNTKKATYIVANFDYTNNFLDTVPPSHPIRAEVYKDSFRLENIYFSDATVLNQPLYLNDAYFIEYLLRNMASCCYLDEKFIQETLSAYMRSVIVTIVREFYSNKESFDKNSYQIAQKTINYIQNNYSKRITNSDFSELFHFNPSYINRVFKEQTGMTIHKFLVDYRINIAKELLRTQNGTINAIALDVGFVDIPHFVKTFKASTNQTPSEYRNSFK